MRLALFDYTSKNILTITIYDQKLKEEIIRVKNLVNGKVAGWIETSREPHQFWEFNEVSRLNEVRKGRKKKLEKAGITQVYQLAAIGENETEIKEEIKHSQRNRSYHCVC